MWVTGSLKRLWGMPVGALLCVLLPTTVLCKSTGALMFLFAGLGTLFWIRWFRNPIPLLDPDRGPAGLHVPAGEPQLGRGVARGAGL